MSKLVGLQLDGMIEMIHGHSNQSATPYRITAVIQATPGTDD
jgi:hypothetical protein